MGEFLFRAPCFCLKPTNRNNRIGDQAGVVTRDVLTLDIWKFSRGYAKVGLYDFSSKSRDDVADARLAFNGDASNGHQQYAPEDEEKPG